MIIVQTPLRISLMGGGTDFREFWGREGGAVVTTAINKYVYAIVKSRFDDRIYVNYSRKEIVDSVGAIEHGLVREAMRKAGITRGVEITTLADVPSEGSGLGSSSAVTVALLHALYAYQGRLVDEATLAREACEIEIDILKGPIGIQDQYIAAYGNLRVLRFKPDGSVAIERLALDAARQRQLESNLHVFFLDRTRSAGDILAHQRASVDENLTALRRLHDLVDEMVAALQSGPLDRVGELLHLGWLEKKRLGPGVTDGDIDALYERARTAGAIGGKVLGAGGGGFLLVYCPGEHRDRLLGALADRRVLPVRLERDGSKVVFNIRGLEER